MAFPDLVALRSGQANATGDVTALYLKMFGGEIAAAFREKNVMLARVRHFSKPGAKSIQLPMFGKAKAKHMTIGENILDTTKGYLSTVRGAERIVTVDKKLISAVMVPSWDDIVSQYDARSIYSTEIGNALANASDSICIRMGILAARAAAVFTGQTVGAVQSNLVAGAFTAKDFAAEVSKARQTLDEKDVPAEGRTLLVSPALYQMLLRDLTVNGTGALPLIDERYNMGQSNGSLSEGVIGRLYGFEIVLTNHLPTTNVLANSASDFTDNSANGIDGNSYAGDFTKTKALCFSKDTVVALSAQGMKLETDYKTEYDGTLVKASHAMGFGIWRQEGAIEIATA